MQTELRASDLLSLLIDASTGRACLADQSASVLAIMVAALAVVLLATGIAVYGRHRAMSRVPAGALRRAATVNFVLYTAGSIALFILYGGVLLAAC
jgi:hypothetical protein